MPFSEAICEVGRRYGSLVVESRAGTKRDGHAIWWTLCDCGVRSVKNGSELRRGIVWTCGHGVSDAARKTIIAYNASRRVWKSGEKIDVAEFFDLPAAKADGKLAGQE
jgi:hypothetical protein